ncbi:hypothetical protein RFM99_21160 [Mesorhizobium sp. VK4C]|uniref:hypothetical protein n=1 Tax=Mesorhizobium captivum TaxID=3072319 RepID=UPI002A243D74|nr:hypothetical protein [Mesorhizobium sp. VK4C]MDX8500907.1 hypothetical protein [Mesorhizobium sp. VK4C]
MRKTAPFSLIFLAATALLFVVQAFPLTGMFALLIAAPYWSIFLVNVAMLGTLVEALTGRVARHWLVLPFVFYGGYYLVAVQDHLALFALAQQFGAANASVSVPFDPLRQTIIFEGDTDDTEAAKLTQNYGLPVAFSANANVPEQYLSHRLMDMAICYKARENPAFGAASIQVRAVYDADDSPAPRADKRLCELSMPEKPLLSLVLLARSEVKMREGRLAFTRITWTIRTPGKRFQLVGGYGSPLSWVPMPVIGCGIDFQASRWSCFGEFLRERPKAIGSEVRRGQDYSALAGPLGLKRIATADRHSGDAEFVLGKMDELEHGTLSQQLANVDAMIADPSAKTIDRRVEMVGNNKKELDSRAAGILTALERAVLVDGRGRNRAKANGLVLARLLASLPREHFLQFGPRLLRIYAGADGQHWLWEAGPLIGRLGDLGTSALPYLVNPRALAEPSGRAGVEGMCRVGAAGRDTAGPALIALWNASPNGFDIDTANSMYVAMRRIGIDPPPFVGSAHARFAALQTDWADISPNSPPRVCATRAERIARSEERRDGRRLTNLE